MEHEEVQECSLFDVSCWSDWLMDAIANLFLWVWESVLTALADVLESISMPGWMENIGTLSMPDAVLYWTTIFRLPEGLSIMASAYVIRFLIRRIPVIG